MQSAPVSIADAVSRELMGERVLWAASPDRWAYASKYWKTALFGIPFAAFAILWTFMVSYMPVKGDREFTTLFPLWGLMFGAFGLSMLLSPFWAAWTASDVYYVVTERRAIIFEKALKLKIQSFTPSAVAGYERISSGGPGGNIIFQRVAVRSGRGTRVKEIGFIGLPEYAGAEQALNELVSRSAQP
ncbi:MAG: hypothetical protein WAM82_04560 [Thermoanaerobaculia bacterium]